MSFSDVAMFSFDPVKLLHQLMVVVVVNTKRDVKVANETNGYVPKANIMYKNQGLGFMMSGM